MYCTVRICMMDPLKGPSLQINLCSSLHRPIGAPNTSSYFMRNVGGKMESLSFYSPDRPLYIENVALRAMFSLSMLKHVHCTLQSTHEHSMYSIISMSIAQFCFWLRLVYINTGIRTFKGIVSWDIDGLFVIASYSLDVGHLPLGLGFFLILCFHILILILKLARSRSKLYQLFRKRLYSLEKSSVISAVCLHIN
jgi:hypothetical protein